MGGVFGLQVGEVFQLLRLVAVKDRRGNAFCHEQYES
jgi:hypothetical protein